MAGVPPVAKTVKRDRTLVTTSVADDGSVAIDCDELLAVWHALDTMPIQYRCLVRLLTLTACRRDEIAAATWDQIDLDNATLTIPASKSKSGREHVVALSPLALDVLAEVPRFEGSSLLFPSRRRQRDDDGNLQWSSFSAWSKSKDKLDELSGVSDWRLHDLRRSAATGMAALGHGVSAVEAALGHKLAGGNALVGIYNRHSYQAESRRALLGWGQFLSDRLSPTPADNVVHLHAG